MGYFGFLLTRGYVQERTGFIFVSAVTIFAYGGLMWGSTGLRPCYPGGTLWGCPGSEVGEVGAGEVRGWDVPDITGSWGEIWVGFS